MSTETNNETVELVGLPRLENQVCPPTWFDLVEFMGRGDADAMMIVCRSVIKHNGVPAQSMEVARLITTHDHCKRIAKTLCQILNYYPTKEESEDAATKALSATEADTD